MSRPFGAPLVSGPRPAVSMVQTAPVLACSVSAASRLGPEPTASATPSYVPQSYQNAIMGVPVTGSSSAYLQNHSAGSGVNASHSYSQAPVLASAPLISPHCPDRMDSNPIKPSPLFGMVNHHDMLPNGSLWIEEAQGDSGWNLSADCSSPVNDTHSFDLYNPVQRGLQDHLPSEFPTCTAGHQGHVLPDEFPHLDIINELLDDEQGIGMVARVNSGYQSLSNGSHNLNWHYSLRDWPVMSNDLGPSVSSCRFDRARSYHDDLLQLGFGASGGNYNTLGDMILQSSPRPYVNGWVDDFMPNQWPMPGSDVPILSVKNMDNDGYPYHVPEFHNLNVGIKGYTVFHPSNGL